jgi:hypothetical protein
LLAAHVDDAVLNIAVANPRLSAATRLMIKAELISTPGCVAIYDVPLSLLVFEPV